MDSHKDRGRDRVAETAVEYDPGLAERVRSLGVKGASIVDLMAVGLSRREADIALSENACRRLLARCGSLRGLSELSKTDLIQDLGLDEFEAMRAMALIEIGRRISASRGGPKKDISTAQDVVDLLDDYRYEKREHFLAVLLDSKNAILRVAVIHVGTLTESIVGAREVFREAIRDGASSVIIAHNHPSGDPTPSPEDFAVTRKLVEVGRLLDTPVLDHVILGEHSWVSFADRGLLRS